MQYTDLPPRHRRTGHARVRPYIRRPVEPAASPDAAVPAGVLHRVLEGLRRLPDRRSRRQAAAELAARLGPLARESLTARPAAWAPAEVNAPSPDVTTTARLEAVSGS